MSQFQSTTAFRFLHMSAMGKGLLFGIFALGAVTTSAAPTTDSAGGAQSFDNMQPSLVLTEFMPFSGIFPSRVGVASANGLGSVRIFAGNFNPGGTASAQGQLLPIAQNQALFSLLGTNYGGNGVTNFALPDLSGRTMVHSGASSASLGVPSGVQNQTLTLANLPAHAHTLPPSANLTGSTGGSLPFSNLQPSLGLNYLIATQGVFPSRGGGGGGVGQTFVGEISAFAGNFAPAGFAFADGQLLSIAQNTALFSILGTTYGGDGRTTFALPDLRDRTIIGAGQGAGLSDFQLGSVVGAADVTLSAAQLSTHTHGLPLSSDVTGATGAGLPFSNLQSSLALTYLIAMSGVFPTSSGGIPDDFLIGEITAFAGNFVPDGWATADGTLLQIADNEALFFLIGTTFGGDGQTTFALPDLRGRTIIGDDSGSIWNVGDRVGLENIALTEFQMPAHVHALAATDNGSVPEPGTVGLLVSALGLMALARRLVRRAGSLQGSGRDGPPWQWRKASRAE